MNLHRRNFLLAVTLATAAATPAFGQVTPTVGAANSGKQGAAVPDFSGVWTHSIPGFEPLAHSAGSSRIKLHLLRVRL